MLPRSSSGHLYEVLGLSPDCAAEDVRRQYRRLALQLHPDRTHGVTTLEFQEVEEANRVLSDPEQRRLYDTVGREGLKKLGDLGVPNVLMTVRIIQPIILTVGLLFGLLLLTLILVAVKIDSPKPGWSWAAVLSPLWVLSPLLALLGLACLGSGLRACALEPVLVGLELLLLVAAPAVGCAVLQGRLRPTFIAFIPWMLLYASWTARALYGLLPPVYAQRQREEEEMTMGRTEGTDADSNSGSSTASNPSHAPCRSRTYWRALLQQLLQLTCVVAFLCLCVRRARQGPVRVDTPASERAKVLSFWIVFAPLIVYFALMVLCDFAAALWCTRWAGERGRGRRHSRSERSSVSSGSAAAAVDAVEVTVLPVSEPDDATSRAQPRGGAAYGTTSGSTPYSTHDEPTAGSARRATTSTTTPQARPEDAHAAEDRGGASKVPCCSRIASALLSTVYHACWLYMTCMWAAKVEVEYNHVPTDRVPLHPSVYAATFPLFFALAVPMVAMGCLSCVVSALIRRATAAAEEESGAGGGADGEYHTSGAHDPSGSGAGGSGRGGGAAAAAPTTRPPRAYDSTGHSDGVPSRTDDID